jgi:hypothetical protein
VQEATAGPFLSVGLTFRLDIAESRPPSPGAPNLDSVEAHAPRLLVSGPKEPGALAQNGLLALAVMVQSRLVEEALLVLPAPAPFFYWVSGSSVPEPT